MGAQADYVRQAVFLVGGKGTRLGALTAETPKPLLEVAPGLRFLDILLEDAARQGFSDLILLAGHLGEQVEALYEGREVRGARVSVIREPAPAGTGGALRYAAERLDPFFLLANGDSLFEINLRAFAARPDPATMGRVALRHVPDMSRYGSVELADGRIAGFAEKRRDAGPGLINGGIYLLSREILGRIGGPCSLEADLFPALAAEGRLAGEAHEGYFIDIGLPDTFATAQAEAPGRRVRPAVFFDRDGTLNIDEGYMHRPEDLVWTEGAPQAIRRLNDANYLVIVVTNQAGVARGLYDEAQIGRFHAQMQAELAAYGAHIDALYYCPFHEAATAAAYRFAEHPDRKPNPGMIRKALTDWPIRLEGSFLVGDRSSDIEAARRAGLPGHLYQGGNLDALVARAIEAGGDLVAP